MHETATEIQPQAEEIERLKQELKHAQERIDALPAQVELAAGLVTQPGEQRPGFMTKETLLKRLDEELDRVRRYDKQVCLLLLGIEGWDELRRQHTPDVASHVLRASGRMISQFMRRSDMAAELEDGRFLLMMPETGLEGGHVFGDRLCQAVEGLQVLDDKHGRILLRASGGIVQGSRDTLTRDSLLLLAGDALRQAQKQGGGRVCGG